MALRFTPLEIPEIILIEPTSLGDERGLFREMYKQSEFAARGIPDTFVQVNYSFSKQGVVRGLHYQKHPRAQAKLIMVALGQIFDVAVDIRKGSPTYARWVSYPLSAESGRMLYVPAGFAHGFYVLSPSAAVMYQVTGEFAPECDRGILWNDPEIGIAWPGNNAQLSPKDMRLPLLKDAENNFEYGVR